MAFDFIPGCHHGSGKTALLEGLVVSAAGARRWVEIRRQVAERSMARRNFQMRFYPVAPCPGHRLRLWLDDRLMAGGLQEVP